MHSRQPTTRTERPPPCGSMPGDFDEAAECVPPADHVCKSECCELYQGAAIIIRCHRLFMRSHGHRSGSVLFSDGGSNTIYKWRDGAVSVYARPAGYTGPFTRKTLEHTLTGMSVFCAAVVTLVHRHRGHAPALAMCVNRVQRRLGSLASPPPPPTHTHRSRYLAART
jgi:hypothetical protein